MKMPEFSIRCLFALAAAGLLAAPLHAQDLVGVGAFERGGKREQPNLIFKRDTALNNRIGQALGRLERSITVKKFVRPAVPS